MASNKRTFRHSFWKTIGTLLLLPMFVGVFFFFGEINYFVLGIAGVLFIFALSFAISSVEISTDGISATNLLGKKSLLWSEIDRATTLGQTLRLHNRDDSVILSIDSQLEKYREISNFIFKKRPDLSGLENTVSMSREWLNTIADIGTGIALIGMAFLFTFYLPRTSLISIVPFFIGTFIIVQWLLSPQNILLENQNMVVSYFFKKTTYAVNDIKSIALIKNTTRNGYTYFIRVNLNTGKSLKISGFKPGSILAYQILKKWHSQTDATILMNRN